jgi:putative ABC transport system ATP-binding protein
VIEPAPEDGVPLVRLEKATRTYRTGPVAVKALRETTLELARGDSVAVMGPSGSGKSTLLHILGCLDRPTSGRYYLGGKDVSAMPDRDLARLRNRAIGFVFQRFHLLEDESALRNVELPLLYGGVPRAERHRRATEALEWVDLAHRVTHLPGALSGGEQQRVALARALVKRPDLLLADEPTGNLDSVSGARILDLVAAEHERGTTVVLITHEAAIAERAGRLLKIHDGVVTEDAPPTAS